MTSISHKIRKLHHTILVTLMKVEGIKTSGKTVRQTQVGEQMATQNRQGKGPHGNKLQN